MTILVWDQFSSRTIYQLGPVIRYIPSVIFHHESDEVIFLRAVPMILNIEDDNDYIFKYLGRTRAGTYTLGTGIYHEFGYLENVYPRSVSSSKEKYLLHSIKVKVETNI